jgi:hypothetical protein
MICHKCTEAIEVGEAMTQIPTPSTYHWWFFHPGCFVEWNEEQEKQISRLNNIRQLAGHIH